MSSRTIIPINENTWILDEGFVRFFLLAGKEKALLVDSGASGESVRGEAAALTSLPLELLNTHVDGDHTAGNHEFDWVYMSPSEYAHYYHTPNGKTEVRPVWGGDVLDLGDRPLEIIALPGHTPGSIAVLDKKGRMLFSGDPIQDGGIYMFGPQRDMHAYRHSLDRLLDRADEFDLIFPCHGSCPVKPELIGKLRDAAGKVLAGELGYAPEEMHGASIATYDAGVARFFCDLPNPGV